MRVSFHDRTVEVVRAGDTVYLKAPPDFYTDDADDLPHAEIAAELLGDRWIAASDDETAEHALLFVPDWRGLARGGFASAAQRFTNAGETTVDGRPAVALRDGERGTTSYVSSVGEPLPLQIVTEGDSGEKIVFAFSDWGEDVEPDPPKDAIELSGVQRTVLDEAIGHWVPALE